jgi:hypothetical protein
VAIEIIMAQSDDEDDYMKMVFEEPKQQKYETSLQRAARRRREAEERSRQKTKSEREAEEREAREAALETALPTSSKGFKMMAKFGFKQGDSLGKSENARKVPIAVELKEDRSGIGMDSEKKRKFRERMEEVGRQAKRSKEEDLDYREFQRQQIKQKKLEKDLNSAQRAAERLHDEANDSKGTENVPLKNINVIWRRLARDRLEKLHKKQEEQNLKNSLLARMPSFADDDEDEDDRTALGSETKALYIADDLEEEDPELDEFESLPIEERLDKVVSYLRENYHYCYWCGHRYSDASMEGCPGATEEEHD